jgi:hypothetical protein
MRGRKSRFRYEVREPVYLRSTGTPPGFLRSRRDYDIVQQKRNAWEIGLAELSSGRPDWLPNYQNAQVAQTRRHQHLVWFP